MSFMQRLESLRAKPEHIRKRYAFWSALGFTAVIFGIWISSYTALGSSTHSAVASAVSNVGTPAQSLVANVGSVWGDVRDLIFGARKVTYSSIEVLPGKK